MSVPITDMVTYWSNPASKLENSSLNNKCSRDYSLIGGAYLPLTLVEWAE
jgi:hypothetical protein